MTMFPRSRYTRYVAAAVSAIFVVSTLYYVQVPHSGEYLPHWTDSVPTQDQASSSSDYLWDTRAAQVKQAFRHAYGGYKRYANGYDELRPLSNTAVNNFNGWNVSMYDSLDTMILMGLWDEFADALPVVQHGDFRAIRNTPGEGPWTRSQYAPFFETAIRYLGGLLAAYALSGESILLDRASDLATLLEPAFNTPEGLPRFGVNTNTTATTPALSGIFAEVASCQLEWTYAAHATGNKTHYDKASKVISTLADAMEDRQGGMFPTHWHLSTGRPTSESRSVGAAADSGHEYLLKQYLLTGKTDIENLEMYLLSMNEVLTRLLYITPERGLLYVTETSGKAFTASHTFEHLACFFPGLLALGAHTLDLTLSDIDRNRLNPEARRQYDILIKYDLKSLHMAAAEGLATSCWLMYADQPSGLGPEVVSMAHDTHVGGKVADRQGKLWIEAVEEWRKGGKHGPLPGLGEKKPIMYTRPEKSTIAGGPWDYVVRRTEYFLRPETIESIYIMWRTTGNPVWRERGWAIFEAIERETKTASGYASLKKVTQSPGLQMDDQPSYFLAETLKYLYLLFKNEDLVPLDKWVFNTEAHPLPIFTWSDWQKHKFGIPR